MTDYHLFFIITHEVNSNAPHQIHSISRVFDYNIYIFHIKYNNN